MPDEQKPPTDKSAQGHESDAYPVAKRMALRYGNNPWATLEVVGKDNEKYRARLRAATKGEELKSEEEKLPEGSVVLTAPDAQSWNAYRAIGKSPAEIVSAMQTGEAATKERDTLKQSVMDHEREKVTREAAQAVGYKPSVLGEQLRGRNAVIEMRDADVTTNGKVERKKLPHVVIGEGKDAKVEQLTAYAERELVDYLPALKADAAPSGGTSRVSYPEQKPTGMAHTGGDKVGQHIAATNQRNAGRPNPLLQPKRTAAA